MTTPLSESSIKAFVYLRVSGIGQLRGEGFDRQLLACEEYARLNGLDIVEVFREEGVSGTRELEDREALSLLFAALEENGVKTVLVERLDRVARDLMVQEQIIRDMSRSGFTLISTCEPDLCSTDPSRVLMRQIFGAIAQYDKSMTVLKLQGALRRKKIRDGIAKGYTGEDALRYGKCQGPKLYGELAGEAETLAKMQTLRQSGSKLVQIVEALNDSGSLARSGRPWTIGSLHRILGRVDHSAVEN